MCLMPIWFLISSLEKILGKFSKNEPVDTGIKVYATGDIVNVELHIVVTYGMNINAIAASITEKVKYAVKETAGITVNKVTIKIDEIMD